MLKKALIEGEWSASRPAALIPEKQPPIPIGQEAGWAPEPVWTRWRKEKYSLIDPAGEYAQTALVILNIFFQDSLVLICFQTVFLR